MMNKNIEKRYLNNEDLSKINGGKMGDGKYGGDGGFDGYFSFVCPKCGSNHFFVIDYLPPRTYKDGTPRPCAGLFRCMDCGKTIEVDNIPIY